MIWQWVSYMCEVILRTLTPLFTLLVHISDMYYQFIVQESNIALRLINFQNCSKSEYSCLS